ncbi:MAG TPA: FkbM family methyltransferase [Vicinamibacterales bacterium]|nr:FkbM family methyltransferase [Vicinamibacterales bacterium]
MRDMWRYIHARTFGRVASRLRGPAPDRTADVQRWLRRTIESRPVFSILQVGAYDGVSNDWVHDLLSDHEHTRAVLLEPQPGPFAKLQQLWEGNCRIVPTRAALSDATGERPLYVIADAFKHRHPFPDQVSSFFRWRVEQACSRYAWRPSANFITSVTVPTIDWRTLVQRYGRFDLVAIDAEGYDAEILHQIDLKASPPDVILYEHVLLPRRVRRRCEQLLTSNGYSVRQVNQNDTLATLSDLHAF